MTTEQSFNERFPVFLEAHFPWITAAFLRCTESALLSQVDLEPPILDIGCGDGSFAKLTFSRKVDVGIDLEIYGDEAYASQYIQTQCADVRKLPFPDKSFMTVVSNSTLEHVDGIDLGLSEMARVLKPGGRLIFTGPCAEINSMFWACKLRLPNSKGLLSKYHKTLNHMNILPLRRFKWVTDEAPEG